MNYNTTYNKILTDENMMETIQHYYRQEHKKDRYGGD